MFSTVIYSKEKMLLVLTKTELSVTIAVANFNFTLLPNYGRHKDVLALIIKISLKA